MMVCILYEGREMLLPPHWAERYRSFLLFFYVRRVIIIIIQLCCFYSFVKESKVCTNELYSFASLIKDRS